MSLVRDLGRRKVRTSLTILGITIGIWALVVFSSMANKINAMVDGGSEFYAGKITATAKGGVGFVQSPLALETAGRVADVDGVDVVVPQVSMLLSDEATSLTLGQKMIIGEVAGSDQGREAFVLRPATGRLLTAADEGSNVTVLGSDLARQGDLHVGDAMSIRGESFEVVGVLEPTLTAPDLAAIVPLAAAQDMYVRSLPPLVAENLDPGAIVNGLTIFPEPGAEPETVAAAVRESAPELVTMTSKDFDEQVGSATAILSAILVGIALISLAVGGLSVVNTMAMSIAERTREIGIKRAVGGSRRRIVRELVIEAGVIGFLGGALGLALGALLVALANEAGRSSGMVLFSLTPGTAVLAVGFSTVLGALAGLVPALHAARLDPVAALRYE
jgi:putative ABC transport system permease protein